MPRSGRRRAARSSERKTLTMSQIRRKLVIVGDGACGKVPFYSSLYCRSFRDCDCQTSLLCCFALGEFPKEYVRHPLLSLLFGL